MFLAVRWRPVPQLALVAVVLVLPAVAVWVAAIAAALGLGVPLDEVAALPLPARRLVFLTLTLAAPAAAGLCGALAVLGGELRAERYELTARLTLPRPPLHRTQVCALLVLVGGIGLAAAMAGHLAADCLLGGDCPSP